MQSTRGRRRRESLSVPLRRTCAAKVCAAVAAETLAVRVGMEAFEEGREELGALAAPTAVAVTVEARADAQAERVYGALPATVLSSR
eukprot:3239333-Prymnesium_polylepis.1